MRDKLGRLIKQHDKVAVAILKLNDNLHTYPYLNIGEVIYTDKEKAVVRFDDGSYDDITHKELIVINISNAIRDVEKQVSTDIYAFANSFGIT